MSFAKMRHQTLMALRQNHAKLLNTVVELMFQKQKTKTRLRAHDAFILLCLSANRVISMSCALSQAIKSVTAKPFNELFNVIFFKSN